MSLVLDPTELQALTGYRQTVRQVGWLRDRGWVFIEPTRRGEHPKVDRTYYLARMRGEDLPAASRSGPRLEFMLQPR